ncbi:hypothetical protein CI238_13158 [Colletotrichum incanum]|uniref:Uncharacterized protein n=1 Tax=Colletotrichum incanum TaxID=1573173 RepID=A0A167ASF9_COLIC|nr:hypothetical protein CI238_13158 [Colletotrichum incanum]
MPAFYDDFELKIPQLAIQAGKVLTGKKRVPPIGDEGCLEADAKCFKFDWLKEHSDLWDHAFNDKAV